MGKRFLTLLLSAGVALSPLLVSSPAEAARVKPSVTLRVADSSVTVGTTVRFTGKVSGRSAKAPVRLQSYRSGKWVTLKKGSVSGKRTYVFKYAPAEGVSSYRVAVVRTRYLRAATSPVRRVSVTAPVVTEPPTEPPTEQPPTAEELAQVRGLILQQTNDYRASQGLAPLQPMDELDSVAQRWTVHMAETGDFRHNPSYAAEYPAGWWGAAENIAYGYSSGAVVQAWINSEGHRLNMVGNYTHLGVGYAEDANGRPYYTQNFARYDS